MPPPGGCEGTRRSPRRLSSCRLEAVFAATCRPLRREAFYALLAATLPSAPTAAAIWRVLLPDAGGGAAAAATARDGGDAEVHLLIFAHRVEGIAAGRSISLDLRRCVSMSRDLAPPPVPSRA